MAVEDNSSMAVGGDSYEFRIAFVDCSQRLMLFAALARGVIQVLFVYGAEDFLDYLVVYSCCIHLVIECDGCLLNRPITS